MIADELDFLGSLIRLRAGIVIGRDKAYLLENRLAPIAARRRLAGLSGLVAALRANADEALIREVVEAMTTNETLFFRDGKPFDLLREHVLPALTRARAGSRCLRFWSAACSTGQEPYSLAMLLSEEAGRYAGWRHTIVATDICRSVLNKARAGVYSQFEVQRGLPVKLMLKYFQQNGSHWEIAASVRSMVEFREHNITRDPPPLPVFDVILCRNLLIYFDEQVKRQVLDKLAGALAADGVLFLGGAESVLGISDRLEPLPDRRGAYRLVDPGEARRPALARAG